jgi:hypothetical protein
MTERAVRSFAASGVGRVSATRMTPPKIQALGITQQWPTTRWKATGDVEGISWLAAWGPSLITALETLQALAARRDVPPPMHSRGDSHV